MNKTTVSLSQELDQLVKIKAHIDKESKQVTVANLIRDGLRHQQVCNISPRGPVYYGNDLIDFFKKELSILFENSEEPPLEVSKREEGVIEISTRVLQGEKHSRLSFRFECGCNAWPQFQSLGCPVHNPDSSSPALKTLEVLRIYFKERVDLEKQLQQ